MWCVRVYVCVCVCGGGGAYEEAMMMRFIT